MKKIAKGHMRSWHLTSSHRRFTTSLIGFGLVLCAVVSLMLVGSASAGGLPEFICNLTYPGNDREMIDPGSIYYDPGHEEIFVTDAHDWRVVIFDKRGRYTYDFRDPEHLVCAQQMAVDSLGRIYVLRIYRETPISVFEYNGDYLFDLRLTDPATDKKLSVHGLVIDAENRIFVLAKNPPHIYCFSTDGKPLYDFPILHEGEATEPEPDFGTMALVNGKLVIPLPVEGVVVRYTTDGKPVTTLGSPGDGEDQFGLPIAASGDEDGNIYVLDKHKHSILVFEDSGRWLRIMGGRGMSPGWFYHPTALAVTGRGKAIVGQTYLGRVQSVAWTEPEPNADVLTRAGEITK